MAASVLIPTTSAFCRAIEMHLGTAGRMRQSHLPASAGRSGPTSIIPIARLAAAIVESSIMVDSLCSKTAFGMERERWMLSEFGS